MPYSKLGEDVCTEHIREQNNSKRIHNIREVTSTHEQNYLIMYLITFKIPKEINMGAVTYVDCVAREITGNHCFPIL